MWSQTYGGSKDDFAESMVQTSDGGFALAGYTYSFGVRQSDFWLVKTDMYGNMEWNRTYRFIGSERVYSLVETSDGGYALAGYTNSSGGPWDNFWLVKTDENGNMEWNQTYGGTNSDYAKAIVQTSDGGFALAGTTSSFGAGGRDFWLVKTESMYDEADENGAIPQSPSLIAATIVIAAIAIVGVAILVYLKRIEKKRNRVTFTHG